MTSYKTNFSLLDSRQYVHSSSILNFIVDLLPAFCKDNMHIDLMNIKFRSEVKRNGSIMIYNECQNSFDLDKLKFEFQFQCGNEKYFAYFFEDNMGNIDNRLNSNYSISGYQLDGFLNGNCRLYFDETIYSNIIQFNKMVHLSTFNERSVNKITNLSMNNIPLFRKSNKFYDVEVCCNNLFYRETGNGFMTLNKIDLTGGGNDISLEISFLIEFD